ncbi:MAG: GerW family sporulation protein [Oscillospiraceae bacterium]|nr:GerW family sporulation protein [Oscillospiraceae bacterium]MBR4192734.1 GerW family sporulation protein [Oscillospiraceae bacterium]
MNNNISEMLTSSMEKVQKMVDVNTIIGQPVNLGDGVTIVPITKVHIGMGGGGTEFATKSALSAKKDPFGGGLGAGVSIDPVAFLVIKGDSVRMLPVAEPASTTVDRIVEQAPDLIDKLADFLDSRKPKEEA